MDWDVIFSNYRYLIGASRSTIRLAVISVSLAMLGGVTMGVLSVYAPKPVRLLLQGFYYFVRAIPLLVILFLGYYMTLAYGFAINRFTGAVIGISIYFSVFIAEIVRGTIQSVPSGQIEAAYGLGMRKALTIRKVVLPQAMRTAMRPIINNWMILIKGTSYASVIGVFELTRASREVVERTFRPIEIFLVALVFYFIICTAMELIGSRIERRLKYEH
jgi:His/Glu/Gln/Arg/opine family amino acid ABC transporter permease subunit